MKKLAVLLINIYRNHVSPFKIPCCRFVPTCSEYALAAFEKYNFFKAFGLTVCRILRCNPFNKGGYDPLQ
jgi:putative membrane protein insertion efficiency factor